MAEKRTVQTPQQTPKQTEPTEPPAHITRWRDLPSSAQGDMLARARSRQITALPLHLHALGVQTPAPLVAEFDALVRLADLMAEPETIDAMVQRMVAGDVLTLDDMTRRAAQQDLSMAAAAAYDRRFTETRGVVSEQGPAIVAAIQPAWHDVLDRFAALAGRLPDDPDITADALLAAGQGAAAEAVYQDGRQALALLDHVLAIRTTLAPDWARLPFPWFTDDSEPLHDRSGQPIVPPTTAWSWLNVVHWAHIVRHRRPVLWLPTTDQQRQAGAEAAERQRRQAKDAQKGKPFIMLPS